MTYYIVGKMLLRYWLKNLIKLLASYYVICSITFKMAKMIALLAGITLLAIITLSVARARIVKLSIPSIHCL